jgi:hypothetical protein
MIEQDLKDLMLRVVRLERQANCQHRWNDMIECHVKGGYVVGMLKFCEKCALSVINRDGLRFMDFLSFYQEIVTSPGWYKIDGWGKKVLERSLKNFKEQFGDKI